MDGFTQTTKAVRKLIMGRFLDSGRGPNVGQIMRDLGLSQDQVLQSLRELVEGRCLTMETGTENIRMFHPFANITTPYEVEVDGIRKWYAEWAFESLAVCQVFPGKNVNVYSYCPHCYEPIEVKTRDGQVLGRQPKTIVLQFGVPLKRWSEDAIHAWNQMNFFSSEEHVREWEEKHPDLKGATVTLEQALPVITAFGGKRLDFDYTVPAQEVGRIMREVGMWGDFWKPR